MKKFDLVRVASGEHGTFGVFRHMQIPFAVSLERPWKGNKADVSCIPAGDYVCKLTSSVKFGKAYEICDVPGRSKILIHKGNTTADTSGCVLIGEQFGMKDGKPLIFQSMQGYSELLEILDGDKVFRLSIYEPMLP